MSKDDYSAFHALDPFFSIVMEGLYKNAMAIRCRNGLRPGELRHSRINIKRVFWNDPSLSARHGRNARGWDDENSEDGRRD